MTHPEFSRFKSEINLTQYAAHLGYQIDARKSTRSSIAMRKDSDKVIISKRGTLWVYFSVTDETDNGTIIDFATKRTGADFYAIGQELQNWLTGGATLPDPQSYVPEITPQEYDSARVAKIFKRCKPVTYSRYLASRGLTRALLKDGRFAGRIYTDRYQNAAFPHYKHSSVCGLELKNHDKALFVRGSEKTLWRSNAFSDDTTLIIGEAVIDALSYHALHDCQQAIYTATGGGLSPEQGEIIKGFVSERENLAQIILIPDHDEGGAKLETRLCEILKASSFTGAIKIHKPDIYGQDWNDILQGRL
ncbi:MAG TPA: DUF3991 domain-containing protein [Micavibrio sp.]|nr:DUF3991 domain-containing protein [Micavibrio sp.]HIL29309.1 DUF3991 domain-containing protein [Micavibrio sp.]